ncbi:ATP-dependent nuclease [Pseudomonas syringae group genomosp. 3]|uniref:ATPase AAA n=1 Tax=Pseudomonas syringae pv. viburni TaxID=251703 RepID=A0A0Q0DT78_9PSED|nr:AAA family ATPase [Pseudomonas syringae group genomosp. 3]KPZ11109.1 hypothetical protein ALO40_200057 [Pseudomonas syringae pv. viburni]
MELEVHIPEGVANIDEKWKVHESELRIVRSLWRWDGTNSKSTRFTWDPQSENWAMDGKAGGADNVFKSRLPKPIRIGSLEDADTTEKNLLTFALAPLITAVERERQDGSSNLANALSQVIDELSALSGAHAEHFNLIASKVSTGFKGIFPGLDVLLDIKPASLTSELTGLVKKDAGLKVKDGNYETSVSQQGTGARRALFWSMLQVFNELNRDKETREVTKKQIQVALKKAMDKKPPDQAIIDECNLKLEAIELGNPIPKSIEDPALPGYLLLIDEPENALHPMAARAAQRHLYKLAENPDWQIMLTTHSPYFINALEDHTTIIRLERPATHGGDLISPKTYRSDLITFQGDEKRRLQALQHIDPSLAEIFFGSYPILVEGDTEHAAFLATIIERQHELADKVTIVRARGKGILLSLISVLKHFQMDFGIVHDSDAPYNSKGGNNSMWSLNSSIRNAIASARDSGITVRHKVSIPDFERFLGGEEESKDKPLMAYLAILDNADLGIGVQNMLNDLVYGENHHPFGSGEGETIAQYEILLRNKVISWAENNGLSENIKFKGLA